MSVFVLDRRKRPLMPCSEKRARKLLAAGRARVHRLQPFTIRLVDRLAENSVLQPVRIKLDPGSKTTGIAVVRDGGTGAAVLFLAELHHRGRRIGEALTARRVFRRRRRGNLRYRPARFDNRTKPAGWLPPSLQHRVDTTASWVRRLSGLAPVTGIAMELVRFDLQKMENPEISGVEYQRGELFGYEVREYLLEKWGRRCAYCGVTDVPLNLDHIHPKARGGSDRVSNLTLACQACNETKGAQPVENFLAGRPDVLRRILARAKAPLAAATAVNATRWALFNALRGTGLPVETGSGGRTKWNRARLGVPKTHALDAACVGDVAALARWDVPSLAITATGRGAYCRTQIDKFGFPRGYLTRAKAVHGFRTGDIVRATVPKGIHVGAHTGRVAVRATGSFNIQTAQGVRQGIGWKHCRILQRGDGYGYHHQERARLLPTAEAGGIRRGQLR